MTGGAQTRRRLPPLSIRLSAEERAQLERQAGNQPISSYIKGVLLRGATPRQRDSRTLTDHVMLARVLAVLGKSQLAPSLERLGQAAHNGSLYLDQQTAQQLHEAFNTVAAMHFCLLTALGKRPERPMVLPFDLSGAFAAAKDQEGQA